MTLGDYIAEKGYSDSFLNYLLLPMASAIWSSPQRGIYDFPARYLLNFYANHGVLDAGAGVQWRTVTGGSFMYVEPLVAPFRDKLHLNTPIQAVRRLVDGVVLTLPNGEERRYDKAVIATHSDQALRLLADPSGDEQAVLGAMPYAKNRAILHTDERVMPARKAAWASWNYTLHRGRSQDDPAALTYWMNCLQNLDSDTDYFVTLNPADDIAPNKIIKEIQYAHPQYSLTSLAAQRRMPDINGANHAYFCGAYCGHGFHEDGLKAALVVVDLLKQERGQGRKGAGVKGSVVV
jgi:predicted NAD/FAD-binding protein